MEVIINLKEDESVEMAVNGGGKEYYWLYLTTEDSHGKL